MKIFDEDSKEIIYDDSWKSEQKVISILEIVGIKCSAKHFQIEIEIKPEIEIEIYRRTSRFV